MHRPRCCRRVDERSFGIAILILGMLIYATQSALYKRLVMEGTECARVMNMTGPMDMAINPVKSVDVLFIGNIFAAVTNAVVFHRQLTHAALRAVTRRQWGGMAFVTLLYTVAAKYLDYEAVASSSNIVTLVLVFRLEPVNTLVLTRLIFKEKQTLHTYCQAVLIVAGIALAVFLVPYLQGTFLFEARPFFLALGSTAASGLSQTVSRKLIQGPSVRLKGAVVWLAHIPPRTYHGTLHTRLRGYTRNYYYYTYCCTLTHNLQLNATEYH